MLNRPKCITPDPAQEWIRLATHVYDNPSHPVGAHYYNHVACDRYGYGSFATGAIGRDSIT